MWDKGYRQWWSVTLVERVKDGDCDRDSVEDTQKVTQEETVLEDRD